MTNSILDFYAASNTAGLHARGNVATNYLLDTIQCKKGENILEVGFGTGETLVRMLSKFPEAHFFAIETSSMMFEKAQRRLKLCGLRSRASLHYKSSIAASTFPYESNFFDKIYAESVFAIQEKDMLHEYFKETARVLKTGGRLYLNESIWLSSVAIEQIKSINNYCRNHFGIIQANDFFPFIEDWIGMIKSCGLRVTNHQTIDDLPEAVTWSQLMDYRLIISSMYSNIGKLRRKLCPSLRKKCKKFQQKEAIFSTYDQFIEGNFFILEKLST